MLFVLLYQKDDQKVFIIYIYIYKNIQAAIIYTDLVLKKHLLLSMLKIVVLLNIFMETVIHFFMIG